MASENYLDEDWGTQVISIPDEKELKKKENWVFNSKKMEYSVIRYHFYLEKRPLVQFGYGNAIGSFSAEGVDGKLNLKQDYSIESINVVQYCKQKLKELTITPLLDFKLLPLLDTKVSGGIKFAITDETKESTQKKTTQQVSIERTVSLPPTLKGRIVWPRVYQKYAIDIQFIGVDYLTVRYKKSFFGLIKKRKKEPELLNNQQFHNNFEIYDFPVCTIYLWDSVPINFELISEEKYNSSLINPFETEVHPPKRPSSKHIGGPFKPTLYSISNKAFPLKEKN